MAVPKKKTSKTKKRMRRSHDNVAKPNVIFCECGAAAVAHRVCPDCGKYGGRQYTRTGDAEK
jgi:large subunit ribosomal protein L32